MFGFFIHCLIQQFDSGISCCYLGQLVKNKNNQRYKKVTFSNSLPHQYVLSHEIFFFPCVLIAVLWDSRKSRSLEKQIHSDVCQCVVGVFCELPLYVSLWPVSYCGAGDTV